MTKGTFIWISTASVRRHLSPHTAVPSASPHPAAAAAPEASATEPVTQRAPHLSPLPWAPQGADLHLGAQVGCFDCVLFPSVSFQELTRSDP